MSPERATEMSYTSLNYHIVFSTKNRKPFLQAVKQKRICEYIVGVAKSMNSKVYIINGSADHVHLAVSLNTKTTLADFIRNIKSNSSRWIKESFSDLSDFAWQDEYSAFTVSYSGLDNVIKYINNQQEHHKKLGFDEELVAFLKKHNVEYDKRYIGG